jgi:hypothetical protein
MKIEAKLCVMLAVSGNKLSILIPQENERDVMYVYQENILRCSRLSLWRKTLDFIHLKNVCR